MILPSSHSSRRALGRAAWLGVWIVALPVSLLACSDDDATPNPVPAQTGGTAGSAGSAGSSGVSGASGSSGVAGSSGTAGSAGASGSAGSAGTAGSSGGSGMAGTAGALPCDEPCHTSTDVNAPAVCCGTGQQCCEATVFGYQGADICRPNNEACPLGCADSPATCNIGEFCQLDATTQTKVCKDTCDTGVYCGFNECCPLGSTCEGGTCLLPNLAINVERLKSSAVLGVQSFDTNSCEVVEQCITEPGDRSLLRFDLETPNHGEGDMRMGNPEGNPLFVYSPCHQHYHFESYARYQLLDAQDNVVASGHKQAFCLLDSNPVDPGAAPNAKYNCSFQGIQAGWADVYGRDLPCQWVDVTGVAPGEYRLKVTLNGDKIIAESSYDDNVAIVDITIQANSCPNGCAPIDAACCGPTDTCGHANDGICDCGALWDWDQADCATCQNADHACLAKSTCPASCTANEGACCGPTDTCGHANNGSCDCAGARDWDAVDCGHCLATDTNCPVNTCPNGCTTIDQQPNCCGETDTCGYAGDGWCDCSGQRDWDAQDCSSCLSQSPSCP